MHTNSRKDNYDDDIRSVLTDVTTETITPSESASAIFHNPFEVLKPPSSGSSTPRSTTESHKFDIFDNESSVVQSQLSSPLTVKATLHLPPSPPTTGSQSVLSARSGASKDWSTQFDTDEEEGPDDNEKDGTQTPTRLFLKQSLPSLSLALLGDDEIDDAEELWITPSKIKKRNIRSPGSNFVISATSGTESPGPTGRRGNVSGRTGMAAMKSACMTGELAMQNVALQMGLNLVKMEEEGVRYVKTWVLPPRTRNSSK